MSDDFFIGYQERAPERVARFLRGRVLVLILGAAGIAVALAGLQSSFARSRFEFGNPRTLAGTYHAGPVPNLALEHPLAEGATRVLLVAFGKHGVGSRLDGFDGQRIELEGTLVYREDQTMLELSDGDPRRLEGAGTVAPPPTSLGRRTLRGEIVDSKCYLGVMKPGSSKPHRACAVRCISGGIPPVLLVRDAQGQATYYLLTDSEGGNVHQRVLDLVAEPVEITGEVLTHDNLLVLQADPRTYRRLEPLQGS